MAIIKNERSKYSIIVTGCDNSGSWAIRGQQLGAAIGSAIAPMADLPALKVSALVIVVKRCPAELLQRVRASGRPWVLDFVDGWPQLSGNAWPEENARRWLQRRLQDLNPSAVVFATSQMQSDSGWNGMSLALPHHAWPKYTRAPWSEELQRVGYEGRPEFLGRWRPMLQEACEARGWGFVENGDLSTCQIGIALRDVTGYVCSAWKANTKLTNLQALGLPSLVSPEQSYREFGSSGQIEITDEQDLAPAFDRLSDPAARAAMGEAAFRATPRLSGVAPIYRRWLDLLGSNDC